MVGLTCVISGFGSCSPRLIITCPSLAVELTTKATGSQTSSARPTPRVKHLPTEVSFASFVVCGVIDSMKTNFARFRVTICGIPELGEHCAAGVTDVLSLLDPEWPDPPAFAAFAPHRRLALRFHDIIERVPDRLAPSREDVERLLEFGRELGEPAGRHLLVHCHAGVSRSTAAAALILAQAYPDRPAREALDAVARIRPRAWPNLRILEFGDALLGRDGEIIAAASAIYRRVLDREPFLEEAMIDGGRGREVIAALGPAAR
jgi:predicted protein tyrosine phosphatase